MYTVVTAFTARTKTLNAFTAFSSSITSTLLLSFAINMFIDVNSLPIEILYEPELNSTAFIENNNVKSAETEVNQLDSTIFEYNDPGQCDTNDLTIINQLSEQLDAVELFRKDGNPRIRKKYNVGLKDRQMRMLEVLKLKHKVLPPCIQTCRKKCTTKISEKRRFEINLQFWKLTWKERRDIIFNLCERLNVKRKVSIGIKNKTFTYKYHLTNENSVNIEVCKTFFLTTFGYKKNNDRVVFDILHKTPIGDLCPPSNRHSLKTKYTNSNYNSIAHDLVNSNIEEFNPSISHYRREHAPNTRYLPSDINASLMHSSFIEKNPDCNISYEFYRQKLKEKHISFATLGNEECEVCESFKLHEHNDESLTLDCDICKIKIEHSTRYTNARALYQQHAAAAALTDDIVYYSADLQKVIMLPRADAFKKVIFVRRLVAYHESFVPLGPKSKHNTLACIWHEAISGRNKEDLISTFYVFFKELRDIPHIVLWLDNCSSQNKNWALLSFLVFIINSNEIKSKFIDLYFFEPGHTFMSADNFHHQVEKALKKQKKTYDFQDFANAVKNAKKEVIVKCMEHDDFFLWTDNKSPKKTNKKANRVMLKNIITIRAVRGQYDLLYKTNLNDENYGRLDFLKSKFINKQILMPPAKVAPCGISESKRNDILNTLNQVLPEDRKVFWKNLPVF
ncbi:unnamed protein product [Macrosiphum euphorbiae]|uniref:DUF7869 domain-containing protein n=1 Tax=Macrosiphum euphorbiae TaxID=13131 RepID=A0AAV0XC26_9HEMI|nr:unnamed protein product [Macrosiphum euphorbiae]